MRAIGVIFLAVMPMACLRTPVAPVGAGHEQAPTAATRAEASSAVARTPAPTNVVEPPAREPAPAMKIEVTTEAEFPLVPHIEMRTSMGGDEQHDLLVPLPPDRSHIDEATGEAKLFTQDGVLVASTPLKVDRQTDGDAVRWELPRLEAGTYRMEVSITAQTHDDEGHADSETHTDTLSFSVESTPGGTHSLYFSKDSAAPRPDARAEFSSALATIREEVARGDVEEIMVRCHCSGEGPPTSVRLRNFNRALAMRRCAVAAGWVRRAVAGRVPVREVPLGVRDRPLVERPDDPALAEARRQNRVALITIVYRAPAAP